MRLSKEFFYTLREVGDEESKSGQLLVRAGYFKKVGNGIYMKLPLGMKVKENVEKIIRKHMNKLSSEVLMPSVIPMDVFEKSGRQNAFGKDMFKLNDRYERQYALGPTDEELFAITASSKINSYKDLPFTIYQIGEKFRDEIRPRLGLIRTREFTMKDAYSFDSSLESLDETYTGIYEAYKNIFDELGINYRIVKADTGAMGGLLSEEFQAITDIGEDIVVLCDNCNLSTNIEICEYLEKKEEKEITKKLEKVQTINLKTIEDVCKYLNIELAKSVKAVILNADNNLVVAFIPGDKELNDTKLSKMLKCESLELADNEFLKDKKIVPGFVGPLGIDAKVVLDRNILKMKNFVVGANEENYHYINANVEDLKYDEVADIVNVEQGDICPNCKCGHLHFSKGIEIGNTFKLGTKYSEKLGLEYLDNENIKHPVVMGSYGIGVERTIAAIVEQNNDEKGIIWPTNIAPFKVAIVVINIKDEKQLEIGNEIYETLRKNNIECIIDDRDQRPGVKFNDMDLIGIPYRITVGKKVNDGMVELKARKEDNSIDIQIDKVLDELKNKLQ